MKHRSFHTIAITVIFFIAATNISASPRVLPSNYSWHRIKTSDITLQEIMPQFQAIVDEFYRMIEITSPYFQQLWNVRKVLDNYLLAIRDINKNCRNMEGGPSCKMHVEKGLSELYTLESAICSLDIIPLQMTSVDSMLSLQVPLITIRQKLYANLYQLENWSIARPYGKTSGKKNPIPQLETKIMDYQLRESFFAGPPYPLNELLSDFHQNFIRPIEKKIIREKNTSFLLARADDLNFEINQFQMKISKSNIPSSPQIKSLSSSIHHKWNTILKSILR